MAKLLIIEDDINMRSLLRTIFELEGFVVLSRDECSKDDLRQIFQEFSPDVLLLDVNLRNVSGLDITRYIRKQFGENVKIVLSSGMPLRGDSLQAGADDFVMKPFMPDELVEKVRNLTQR